MSILCNNGERISTLMKENSEKERDGKRDVDEERQWSKLFFKDVTMVSCLNERDNM